jgi:hypothetical protein
MNELTFDYGITHVRDLHILAAARPAPVTNAPASSEAASPTELAFAGLDGAAEGRGQASPVMRPTRAAVRAIEVNGEPMAPTRRFWTSFFHRFGISDTIFKYFDHAEVFERVAARAKSDEVRYCIERGPKGARLLAVTNPERPFIRYEQVVDMLDRYQGDRVAYREGVLTSTHVPRSGEAAFPIGADAFRNQYVLDTPVDGFTLPKIHLSLLRLLCENGAIGYSNVFRSELSIGKDVGYCLERALDGFDNTEGYAALRQRFESAQRSWASLHECSALYKLLARIPDGQLAGRDEVISDFHKVTGDLNGLYGLANLDALSSKRQRILPARCRIYDLLNFASELATHRTTPEASRQLQAFIGELISDEYDMEGTAEKTTEFSDFLTRPLRSEADVN